MREGHPPASRRRLAGGGRSRIPGPGFERIGPRSPAADGLGEEGDRTEHVFRRQATPVERVQEGLLPDPARGRVHGHTWAQQRRNRLTGVEPVMLMAVGDARRIAHDGQSVRVLREEHAGGSRAEVREGDADGVRLQQRDPWKVAARRREAFVAEFPVDGAEAAACPVKGRAAAVWTRREDRGRALGQWAGGVEGVLAEKAAFPDRVRHRWLDRDGPPGRAARP